MAKVTVDLNSRLLEKAADIFKGKTRSELISIALAELIDKYKQKNLYELFDSDEILIAKDYNYKALRGGVLIDVDDSFDVIEDSLTEIEDGFDEIEDSLNEAEDTSDEIEDMLLDIEDSLNNFGGSEDDFS